MTFTNLAQFNKTVNAWSAMHASGKSMNVILRKLTLDALVGVSNYTPVDTGYCRFNWLVSVNRPTSEVKGGKRDSKVTYGDAGHVGRGSVAGKVPKSGQLGKFPQVYVQNNVEYSEPLNNGTPLTKGNQMVERTLHDLIADLSMTTGAK